MRIASLSHSFPKLSETFILNQIVGLLDRDHEVDVFSESVPDSEADHKIVDEYGLKSRTTYSCDPSSYMEGLEVLSKSLPSLFLTKSIPSFLVLQELSQGTSAPRRLGNLSTVTKSGNYDIYHAHFGTVGNSFLGVSKAVDEPYVVSFYGWDASQKLREEPGCYDELFDEVDTVTVLSENMRSDLTKAGCPREKTHIQPLCIDTRKFSFHTTEYDEGETIRIATVARFVEKKGIEYALRAIAELKHSYDIEYTIAGDGRNREKITTLIRELDIGDSVTLLGWQPQERIAELMYDSHLFLLPSVTAESGDKEGTPTVLLEAQSRGLPIVSTFHAGIPEIVEDGKSGMLVPERDSDVLAGAIQEMVERSSDWPQMGRHGREYVESTHSIEAASESILNLYKSIS